MITVLGRLCACVFLLFFLFSSPSSNCLQSDLLKPKSDYVIPPLRCVKDTRELRCSCCSRGEQSGTFTCWLGRAAPREALEAHCCCRHPWQQGRSPAQRILCNPGRQVLLHLGEDIAEAPWVAELAQPRGAGTQAPGGSPNALTSNSACCSALCSLSPLYLLWILFPEAAPPALPSGMISPFILRIKYGLHWASVHLVFKRMNFHVWVRLGGAEAQGSLLCMSASPVPSQLKAWHPPDTDFLCVEGTSRQANCSSWGNSLPSPGLPAVLSMARSP